MPIIPIVVLLIIGAAFYWGLIKGHAYPLLAFAFGVVGGRMLIVRWFPSSAATIMTFLGWNISYAEFIAALITIMAFGYYMNED